MTIRIAFSNLILSAASSCRAWLHSLVTERLRKFPTTRNGSGDADVSSAGGLEAEGCEEMLLLVRAYIALVDRENMRRFTCQRDRFAYEAAIVLHHAKRRLASQDAQAVLAVYAERTHGKRRGKALLRSFENEPKGEIERQALEDLARFVVRRHRARRRAA